MQVAIDALIRCETLDLFEAPCKVMPVTLHEAHHDEKATLCAGLLEIEEQQLDLFRHSTGELASYAARRALLELDPPTSRVHLATLRGMTGYQRFLADCEMCIELIERRDLRWLDPSLAVTWIQAELWPAAERCLQLDAMRLIRPALLALVENCRPAPLDPSCRQAHASYLWQMMGQPMLAVLAIEKDPHWQRQIEGLLWHAELSEQAQMHERTNADVLELCLAWPDAAESWLCASPGWATRWGAWCELDEELPIGAFPAWCRLMRAVEFPLPGAADERPGAQLLRTADLLIRHPDDLQQRKRLQAQSPTLLAAWLGTRRSAAHAVISSRSARQPP